MIQAGAIRAEVCTRFSQENGGAKLVFKEQRIGPLMVEADYNIQGPPGRMTLPQVEGAYYTYDQKGDILTVAVAIDAKVTDYFQQVRESLPTRAINFAGVADNQITLEVASGRGSRNRVAKAVEDCAQRALSPDVGFQSEPGEGVVSLKVFVPISKR